MKKNSIKRQSVLSVAPYLIRAYHQWIEDSSLTPHILVDCSRADVGVPKSFIQQEKIVLNIASDATSALVINNESISFKARFEEEPYNVLVPINAVLTIYADENGKGMFFENESQPSEKEAQKKPNLTLLD